MSLMPFWKYLLGQTCNLLMQMFWLQLTEEMRSSFPTIGLYPQSTSRTVGCVIICQAHLWKGACCLRHCQVQRHAPAVLPRPASDSACSFSCHSMPLLALVPLALDCTVLSAEAKAFRIAGNINDAQRNGQEKGVAERQARWKKITVLAFSKQPEIRLLALLFSTLRNFCTCI